MTRLSAAFACDAGALSALLGSLGFWEHWYEQAEPLFERALKVWEQALAPAPPDVALSLNHLAGLYREQGRFLEKVPPT